MGNGGGAGHTGTPVWCGVVRKGGVVRPHADGSGHADGRNILVISTTGLEDLMGRLI